MSTTIDYRALFVAAGAKHPDRAEASVVRRRPDFYELDRAGAWQEIAQQQQLEPEQYAAEKAFTHALTRQLTRKLRRNQ